MISVLVANAKGGCGKTTVSTNLATAFANAGLRTALADNDRQRSCLTWLKRRPKDAAPIEGLDWSKATGKPPKDVERQDVARQGLGIFDLSPARRKGIAEDWLPLIRLIEEQG